MMDTDVEMKETSTSPSTLPDLPPEMKINMKLDDIIKYEKMKAGVSHNLQFSRGQYRNSRKKFKPYFRRFRYRSQNWRLRGNGPNTPRYRQQSYAQQRNKIKAFLERKRSTAPFNSVFHRLGWNSLHESARAKVWRARHYFRPQRPSFAFKKFGPKTQHDPDRARKLIQSAQFYRQRTGDGLGDLTEECEIPVQTLTEVNLSRLNEALGGTITSVTEEPSINGEIVTRITRSTSSVISGPYNHGNGMSNLGYNYGSAMNTRLNQAYGMNRMESATMNNMPMMNGYGNMASEPLNQGYPNSAYSGRSNSMFNGRNNSMYSERSDTSFEERRNPMSDAYPNYGNGLNNLGSLPGVGMGQGSSYQNFIIQPRGCNQQEVIQRLNQPREPQSNNSGPLCLRTWGTGIDTQLKVHSTEVPINSRFNSI